MAPASKRKNPWQFVVVEDKEMLGHLAECKPHGAEFLRGCALAVVVLADVMVSDVWVEDASIASIYMQLQAEDLGLGSCWCQIRNREREDESGAGEYVRRLLDIPYQLEVLSIIGFGHKARSTSHVCNGKRYISTGLPCRNRIATRREKHEDRLYRLG